MQQDPPGRKGFLPYRGFEPVEDFSLTLFWVKFWSPGLLIPLTFKPCLQY